MMGEVYISFDIETTGPIPGVNSMISFGAMVVDPLKGVVEGKNFYMNIREEISSRRDPKTMEEFWEENKEAWAATQNTPVVPRVFCDNLRRWIVSIENFYKTKAVFAAYPAGFDFTFLRYYMIKYGNPGFPYSCIDIGSLIMGILYREGYDYADIYKENLPQQWIVENKFPHHPLEDAREQAYLLWHVLQEAKNH